MHVEETECRPEQDMRPVVATGLPKENAIVFDDLLVVIVIG